MGTTRKLTSTILIVFATLLIIRSLSNSDVNEIIYSIYKLEKNEFSSYYYKLIRKPPNSYISNFIITENEDDKVIFIELTDKSCPFKYNYLYVHFTQTKNEGFLYAPPHFRMRENDTLSVGNYASRLVDMHLFQEYIDEKGISNQDSILQTLLDFVGKAVSSNVLIEVKSKEDLIKIIETYPMYNPFSEPTIDINTINLNSSSKMKYFWVRGVGLLEIIVNENYMFTINTVGLLGNEDIIM